MDGNFNNIEYPLYLTQTNQVDENNVNKQMYDYYNNPEGVNNRRKYNFINEKNFDFKNNEEYYNYNCSYINNKNNVLYDVSENYMMNYNYMDPSYYHINNTIHSINSTVNSMDNTVNTMNNSLNDFSHKIEENHKYHYNNPDPNCKLCNKYKISGNIASNNTLQLSTVNHNNEEKKNCLEMTNTITYNVNTLLRNNILSSEYFKSLSILKTYKEVVDEIHAYADHVEPYCIGSTRAPSTLFCCLYKLFTMHLSEKQLKGLIDHKDSCYIRACGFLYLRYAHSPANLWQWYESYLLDEEEFTISADKRKKTTIGEYVQSLLSDDKYFNTVLPRLPIKIKNIYGARLMIINDHRRRLKKNKEKIYKFVKGEPAIAYVNGEWEKGEIGGVINHGKDKIFVRIRKIDGNEKLVNIGYVKLDNKASNKERNMEKRNNSIERSRSRSRNNKSKKRGSRSGSRRRRRRSSRGERSRSRSRRKNSRGERSRSRGRRRRKRTSEEEKHSHNRSYISHRDRSINKHSKRSHERSYKKRDRSISRSNSIKRKHKKEKYENTEDELINKFRKIESQKALATGKDYARRPTSYKSSLSLKVENISTRKKSRSLSPRRISRTVQIVYKDTKNNDNIIAENTKLKELMQKYNKEESDNKKKNTGDLEEMDIMTLG